MINSQAPSREWIDSWHVHPSLNREYDVIDGLRGMAILLVIASHLIYVNPNAGPLVQFIWGIFAAGTSGVTVFFTLSGFLIAYPFWKRRILAATPVTPPGYGWRRFWKIYPPLALSIVLLTPVYIAWNGDTSFIALALQWLAGWPLIHSVSGRLNPVMWSLVVEVQFYILLPLLFFALRRIPVRIAVWVAFLFLLIVPTAFRWWNYSRGHFFALHPEIRLNFPSLLDSFAFGVLLAGLENLQLLKKSWARLGDVGCILLLLSLPLAAWFNLHPFHTPPIQTEILGWIIKVAAALLLFYITDPSYARTRVFNQPWLRWCGLISYEWYLFHQPFITFGREICGPAQGNILKYVTMLGGFFLLGLLTAVLVYRYFSLPILRNARSRIAAPPAREAVVREPVAAEL